MSTANAGTFFPWVSGDRLGMAFVAMSGTPHLALAAAPDTLSMSVSHPAATHNGNGNEDGPPSSVNGTDEHFANTYNQWEPSQQLLSSLVDLLTHSTSAHSTVQSHLFAQLQQYASQRDFNNYLVYILTKPDIVFKISKPRASIGEVTATQQAAGFLLKSNIRLMYGTLHPQVQAYISSQLVNAIGDKCEPVRDVVASCISTLLLHNRHLVALSGLITSLEFSSDSSRPTYLDGSLAVLSRLAEDAPNMLAEDQSQSLDTLLPKIILLCRHQTQSVRARALQILNHLILVMPPALQANIEVLCNTVFSVAEDSSPEVRKRVCTAICLLLDVSPHALAPHIKNVIEYMLQSSMHPNEEVAREASEFWSSFSASRGAVDTLRPYLPRLVPILLNNMVYSSFEKETIDAAAGPDDLVPDRPEDMRPRFHQPKFRDTNGNAGAMEGEVDHALKGSSPEAMYNPRTNENIMNGSSRVPMGAVEGVKGAQDGFGNDSHDGGNDDDDDDDGEGGYEDRDADGTEWNLRRGSAAALDSLSTLFADELLDALQPVLQDKLTDGENWEQRECGVLALGAIAEGCYGGMSHHMRNIFPFLMRLASDSHYMVRCISCWTLSRYAKWIISEHDDASYQQLLKLLLDRMLDRNKVVQKASCSALATLEEETGPLLTSYLTPILRTLKVAFERYQQSNRIALYDVVCGLADAVGSELAIPDYLNKLMPLLISQWNSVGDTHLSMLPILECLGVVFRSIGVRSQQFAANIFSRCANIMDIVYSRESHGERDDAHVEFLISSLDLMCSLAEALGASVDPFVAKSGNGAKPLLPLLFVAMRDNRAEVRQSAFALLGELARARIPSLIPALSEYVKFSVDALDPEYMSVSNNATWALGELIMMAGFLPPNVPIDRETIQRVLLERAVDPLILVVNSTQLNKTLLENSAITLGRLGLVMPDAMSVRLGVFAKAVFSHLRNIRDDVDKEQAFHGMNSMVRVNPGAVLECFVYYVDAIASWYQCKPDLEMEFATILGGFKTSLGDRWAGLCKTLPPTLQKLLKERFRL